MCARVRVCVQTKECVCVCACVYLASHTPREERALVLGILLFSVVLQIDVSSVACSLNVVYGELKASKTALITFHFSSMRLVERAKIFSNTVCMSIVSTRSARYSTALPGPGGAGPHPGGTPDPAPQPGATTPGSPQLATIRPLLVFLRGNC